MMFCWSARWVEGSQDQVWPGGEKEESWTVPMRWQSTAAWSTPWDILAWEERIWEQSSYVKLPTQTQHLPCLKRFTSVLIVSGPTFQPISYSERKLQQTLERWQHAKTFFLWIFEETVQFHLSIKTFWKNYLEQKKCFFFLIKKNFFVNLQNFQWLQHNWRFWRSPPMWVRESQEWWHARLQEDTLLQRSPGG